MREGDRGARARRLGGGLARDERARTGGVQDRAREPARGVAAHVRARARAREGPGETRGVAARRARGVTSRATDERAGTQKAPVHEKCRVEHADRSEIAPLVSRCGPGRDPAWLRRVIGTSASRHPPRVDRHTLRRAFPGCVPGAMSSASSRALARPRASAPSASRFRGSRRASALFARRRPLRWRDSSSSRDVAAPPPPSPRSAPPPPPPPASAALP